MNNTLKVKLGCYTGNSSMAVVGNLAPLLFLTLRSLYGISYSLLGLLVLVNFSTQLIIDLIFSFFSHKFNIQKTVRFMPILTAAGLWIFAASPFIFPEHEYTGLLIGTVLFSITCGLSEVLLSPIYAALPSPDPDRAMSRLHSVYAWAVVAVVGISTIFLLVAGKENWFWLPIIFSILPVFTFIFYSTAKIPDIEKSEKTTGISKFLKSGTLWASVFAIFLGGAAECTMAQWASGYLEHSLGIPKVWGDIFGVAIFAVMLGLGRSLYGRFGKNIRFVLFIGAVGATVCYLLAALSPWPIVGLIGCGFTGFCVSMLWPGSLVVATDRIPDGGVFIYAIMAAGGDLGASIGPQLIGLITDGAMANEKLMALASSLSISPDQLGMKLGMLVGMLFPLIGIFLYYKMMKTDKKKNIGN